jgi:hypothetical protein
MAKAEEQEPVERSMLMDVLTYPVRSGGWLMILIGSVFWILLAIGSFAPAIGVVAAVLAWGFFATYYFDIINSTVNGNDDPPDWPDMANYRDEIVSPLLKTTGVGAISWAPLVLTFFLDERIPG